MAEGHSCGREYTYAVAVSVDQIINDSALDLVDFC